MKLGMCGVCGMGAQFLSLFAQHPDVESVAAADINAEMRERVHRFADLTNCVETLDQLLETDVDCIGIFTPPWTHAELAIKALKAGKHVISACPAGLTIQEIRDLVNTVESTGQIYMVAETSYYYPAAIFARQAWKEGRFGDFVYGEGEYYYRPHVYDFWIRDSYGNMPPMLYPTHSTTMVISVTGQRYEKVTCVGTPNLHPDAAMTRRREEWKDNEISNMTMLGQMSGGGACRINEMRNVGCAGELASLLGTTGSIRQHVDRVVWATGLRGEGQNIDLTQLWKDPAQHPQTAMAAKLPTILQDRGLGHQGSHRFLVDEFVRSVNNDLRPHNHIWSAAKCTAPGIMAWTSLQQDNAWLNVPDFGEPNDGRDALGV